MYFVRLKIEGFRAIESADVEFGRGLNILYGPNDLGKSTLATALKAALLLPAGSTDGKLFVPWHRRDHSPRAVLQFVDDDEHRWRIDKTFGDAPAAELEFSKDDISFSHDCSGREVDEKLRLLLRWGIPGPGGKGAQKGLPHSFLAQALLAEQTDVREVLKESLEEDKDGSGKMRLVAALKTLAQDPLFKKVLDSAQAEYDKHFTATGRAKKAKSSPRSNQAETIKKLTDELAELTKHREASSSAEARVKLLREERGKLLGITTEAETALGSALALREKGREHERLLARLEEARGRLYGIDTELAVVEGRRRAIEALREQTERCAATLEAAAQLHEHAQADERRAEEALRRTLSDDATRERELRRAQLENQHRALQAKILDAEGRRERALAAVTASETAVRAEAEVTRALAAKDTKRRGLEAAQATLRVVEGHLRLAKAVVAYGRWRASKAASDEARVAGEDAARCRAEAESFSAQAAALDESLKSGVIPSDVEFRALSELRRSLDLAEAGLGGGISVVLTPKRPLVLRSASDGNWREAVTLAEATEIDAQGEIELQVDHLVDIRISGGDAEQRKTVETLRARWATDGQPVLTRAGVADLAALQVSLRTAGEAMQRIETSRLQAETLRDKAKGHEARIAELESSVRAVSEREEALVGHDRNLLEQTYGKLGKHWERQADALEAQQENAVEAARSAVTGVDRELSVMEEGARHAEIRRSEALASSEALLLSVGSDPLAILKRTVEEIETARKEAEGLATSLFELLAGNPREVEQSRQALEQAGSAVKSADAARVVAEAQAIEARSQLDRAAGELAILRERSAALDRAAALEALTLCQTSLAAFGNADGLSTDADIERTQAILLERRTQLGELTRELDAAAGALQQVGGATLEDALRELLQAKENAVERERELIVDADSWQLLRDKLQQAEEEQGAHLGRALGIPVTERLNDLTSGRYGSLSLGPTLRAQNVEVMGSGSPEDALTFLSVGTLEQLATLMRIAIAEQLMSAIILDDHLVQSDRARLEWFRRLLRRAGTHIQVLVLTCRPEDYLEAGEVPAGGETRRDLAGGGVRAVDLSKIIHRWEPKQLPRT